MLKFRYDSGSSYEALESEETASAMNAIVKLDLPEYKFALKASAAVGYNYSYMIGPKNYDIFNRLIDW